MQRQTPDTLALFGLPITSVTMREAVSRIAGYIHSGKTHQIATANLDFARNALRNDYLQRIICECSMVLPDGAPMLWASALFGAPLRERVTGVDLIPELARLSVREGITLFFLGSTEATSRAAAEALEQQFPGVHIVGRSCPPMAPLHAMDNEAILREIEAAAPDVLLVGLGNPKQEIWIHRHRDRLRVPVSIGIGGALDMIAGKLQRAPRWVQSLHLEWAYRMAQEPRRLLPRYLRDAAALITHLPLVLAANRMQPAERRRGRLQVSSHGDVRVLSTPALLRGEVTAALLREIRIAAAAGQTVVLDMSSTIRVEADGLGALLEARRLLLAEGLSLWLSAVSVPVRRVLQFSAMADLFRIADTPADAVRSSAEQVLNRVRLGELKPARHNPASPQVAKAS